MDSYSSLERFCNVKLKEWAYPDRSPKARPRPVITVSRQPGSGGEAIARMLARKLGLDLYDREIIEMIARDAQVSEKMVASLDEKSSSTLDNWIAELFASERTLSTYGYLVNLTRVIFSIAAHGDAVIIGRGANFILPPGKRVSLRLVAPAEYRLNRIAKRFGLSPRRARRQMAESEREQRRFVKRHFRIDVNDPLHHDLLINTARVRPATIFRIAKVLIDARR